MVEVVHIHLDVDGNLEQVGECVEVGQAVLVVVIVLLLHGLLLFYGEESHVVDISRFDHQGLVVQVDTFGVYGGEGIRGRNHERIQGLRLDLTGGVTVLVLQVVVVEVAQGRRQLGAQGRFSRGDGGR